MKNLGILHNKEQREKHRDQKFEMRMKLAREFICSSLIIVEYTQKRNRVGGKMGQRCVAILKVHVWFRVENGKQKVLPQKQKT